MARVHPHIDMPTQADLRQLAEGKPELIQQLYLEAHALTAASAPDLQYSVDQVDLGIGYGAHQYNYDGWGMMAVTPFSKWVTVTFLAGAHLPDPAGILEGSAPHMRHVKLRSLQQLEENQGAIESLIQEAIRYRQV
ncbi:MAG: DUF1801 domain-containing protein [Coriobacteriia bacterium]|nr:DUF1801 domain-containing protein [Coriobacteriia bacterium]